MIEEATSTKAGAQRRVDRIAAFRAELEQLSREGVPVPDAGSLQPIAAHHERLLAQLSREFDVDTTRAARRMSRGMQVASLLGAAALTAAIVSFFYRVWGGLSTAGQVALLTLAPVASIGATIVAGRLERTRYVASLFAAVACGAFVLQTIELGRIFNMRGSPHAVGAWALFAIAVAWPWRVGVAFAWGTVALAIYAAALTTQALGTPWDTFMERPETLMLGGAVALAAAVRAPRELDAWGRPVALILVLAAILVLSVGGGRSLLPVSGDVARVLYQIAAVFVAMATIAVGLQRGLADVLVLGSVFAGLFLLTRFVDWWWEWMPKYLFFLILAAVAIAWIWLLRLARRRLNATAV